MKITLTKEELEKAIMSLNPDILKIPDSSLIRFQDEANLSTATNIQGDITEQGKDIKAGYYYLSEGNASGKFVSVSNYRKEKVEHTGEDALIGDNIKIIINERKEPRLPTTTKMLYDLLLSKALSSNSETVYLMIDSYMKERNLLNRKEATKQLKRDIDILMNTQSSGTGTIGKDKFNYTANILSSSVQIRNGFIIAFTPQLFSLALNDCLVWVNKEVFSIPTNHYPNAYELSRKIYSHLKINGGIISVKKLLGYCPEIPDMKTVMDKDKHLYSRIIVPFQKALNYIKEMNNGPIKDWHYRKARGIHLTEEESNELRYNFKFFYTLYIEFDRSDKYIVLSETLGAKQPGSNKDSIEAIEEKDTATNKEKENE